MQGVFHRMSHSAAAAAMLGLAACSSPNDPSNKPDAPVITCPANITVRGVAGGSQPVSFTPTVAGGTLPVNTTCTPVSGASFNVGTAAVSCTAVDASARQSQCSFTVTLTPLLLSVTKFVAFGDSFTEGNDGRSLVLIPHSRLIDPTGTYPFLLEGLLNMEYGAQSIQVVNQGMSGEFIDKGRQRLPGTIQAYRPQAILLLDGYNDLLDACRASRPQDVASPKCASAVSGVVSGYRKMIQDAKSLGVSYVFASTLTPPGTFVPGPSVMDRRIAGSVITSANGLLAPVIRSEGATLVDSYAAFVGHEAIYIGDDGLHPNRAGFQALADGFFNTIKSTVTSTPGFRDTSH